MLLWRSAIGVEARCTLVKPLKVGAENAAQHSAITCAAILCEGVAQRGSCQHGAELPNYSREIDSKCQVEYSLKRRLLG